MSKNCQTQDGSRTFAWVGHHMTGDPWTMTHGRSLSFKRNHISTLSNEKMNFTKITACPLTNYSSFSTLVNESISILQLKDHKCLPEIFTTSEKANLFGQIEEKSSTDILLNNIDRLSALDVLQLLKKVTENKTEALNVTQIQECYRKKVSLLSIQECKNLYGMVYGHFLNYFRQIKRQNWTVPSYPISSSYHRLYFLIMDTKYTRKVK